MARGKLAMMKFEAWLVTLSQPKIASSMRVHLSDFVRGIAGIGLRQMFTLGPSESQLND